MASPHRAGTSASSGLVLRTRQREGTGAAEDGGGASPGSPRSSSAVFSHKPPPATTATPLFPTKCFPPGKSRGRDPGNSPRRFPKLRSLPRPPATAFLDSNCGDRHADRPGPPPGRSVTETPCVSRPGAAGGRRKQSEGHALSTGLGRTSGGDRGVPTRARG